MTEREDSRCRGARGLVGYVQEPGRQRLVLRSSRQRTDLVRLTCKSSFRQQRGSWSRRKQRSQLGDLEEMRGDHGPQECKAPGMEDDKTGGPSGVI